MCGRFCASEPSKPNRVSSGLVAPGATAAAAGAFVAGAGVAATGVPEGPLDAGSAAPREHATSPSRRTSALLIVVHYARGAAPVALAIASIRACPVRVGGARASPTGAACSAQHIAEERTMRMRRALWALSVGALVAVPAVARASSHREAPFVTKNPKVDGTDFYMFNSYDPADSGMVTLIANYLPLQDAYGGPNYFTLDDQALYEIEIDNVGDCQEHLTFQFQFQNTLSNGGKGIELTIGPPDAGVPVAIPLLNVGSPTTAANLNVAETYTVNLVTGNRRTGTVAPIKNHSGGGTTFTKPVDNLGTKTFGEKVNDDSAYVAYANQYIYSIDIPGCSTPGKMFVGQRAEPFAVNLGPTFDLVNAPASVVTAGGTLYGAVPNPLAKKNVTAIELDVPASCLTGGGSNTIVGGWTTASVRQARVYNPKASYPMPTKEGGAWTQVSRLGAPLVNEVVVGLPDKDLWNASEPKDDAYYAKYVTNPTLPALVDAVFGVGLQPMVFPRADLVEAFLTGVP